MHIIIRFFPDGSLSIIGPWTSEARALVVAAWLRRDYPHDTFVVDQLASSSSSYRSYPEGYPNV